MSTTTQRSRGPAGTPERPRTRLTAAEYFRMVDRGVLDEGRRVELIDGELIDKMTKGTPHFNCQTLMTYALIRALPEGWHAGGEGTLELDAHNAPEPDLMVLRGAPGRLDASRFVRVADVGLVVEVAASSLADDLGDKRRKYAAAGVPAYWVMDLVHRRVVAHAEPTGTGDDATYRRVDTLGRNATIPLVLDGRRVAELAVADLLPAD